jgi:hypothetical protein
MISFAQAGQGESVENIKVPSVAIPLRAAKAMAFISA